MGVAMKSLEPAWMAVTATVAILVIGLVVALQDFATGIVEVQREGQSRRATVPDAAAVALIDASIPEVVFDPPECPEFHQVPKDDFSRKYYGEGDGAMWWPVEMPMKAPESCECWNLRVRTQGWGDDMEDSCEEERR